MDTTSQPHRDTPSPPPLPPSYKPVLHHPNPQPGPYPHPSSLELLRQYVNASIHAFILALDSDPDMAYFREEHLAARQHTQHTQTGTSTSTPTSVCTQQTQLASSIRSSPLPAPSPSQHESQNQVQVLFNPEDFVPPPLSAETSAKVEAYIPASILRLPIAFRTTALRAWYIYMLRTRYEARDTLMPPQRAPEGTVLPWEQVRPWEGSVDARAVEVVEMGRCKDGEMGVVKVEREVDVRGRGGEDGVGVGGKDMGGGEVLEMGDGHVLGRDWAGGKGRKAVLVYEGDGGREKECGRRNSVLRKVKRLLKKAFSS